MNDNSQGPKRITGITKTFSSQSYLQYANGQCVKLKGILYPIDNFELEPVIVRLHIRGLEPIVSCFI
jgi:hypothetical protein